MVGAAWWLLRSRSNPGIRGRFAEGFMPVDSVAAAWTFLADQGGRLLMISLPGWTEGWSFNPGEVSWTLPFVGLGLVWLLGRRETRFFGLAVLGFYAARVVASALWIYPLGLGRPDIFSFPVAICLFAAGISCGYWRPATGARSTGGRGRRRGRVRPGAARRSGLLGHQPRAGRPLPCREHAGGRPGDAVGPPDSSSRPSTGRGR